MMVFEIRLSNGYEITVHTDGTIWIQNEKGEGMEVSEKQLATMIKSYFGKNF